MLEKAVLAQEDWKTDPEGYHTRAISRARDKLAEVSEGRGLGSTVGRNWFDLILYGLVVLAFGGSLAAVGISELWSAATGGSGSLGTGLLLFVPLLLLLAIGIPIWKASKPTSPKLALKHFYKRVAHGQSAQARKLVIATDLDEFPRYQPRITSLGKPSATPFAFDSEGEFATYWNGLVRTASWPYCLVKLDRVHVTKITEDVRLVDFELTLTMNTQLYGLLILIALPLAAIADMATRKIVKQEVRKLVVKVDDEWHLFSADFMGNEEHDTTWLPANDAGTGPYRET